MSNEPKIKTYKKIVPMIYAFTTPEIHRHDGWEKIGYTEAQTVEDRVKEESHTTDTRCVLEWQDNAMYRDGSGDYFKDHDFHRFLQKEHAVERIPKTEFFHLDKPTALKYFYEFTSREIPVCENGEDYTLREEQQKAVNDTKEYFDAGGTEYLWNAKPRFGKTLTAYELIREMDFQKVLIVSNRPSISNSWLEDFNKFIGWRKDLCFISDTDALKDKPGVMTRDEFSKRTHNKDMPGFVAFESLQSLKGSVYFGGTFDKLQWMAKEYPDSEGHKQKGMTFDLLIVDESQEGVDTIKTDRAFQNISRKHTLYLSGTPFKAIANEQFKEEQIFNWTYVDEQNKKEHWPSDAGYNPYEDMPKLNMYTYQVSNMIYDKIKQGADLSDEDNVEYEFDLNEFFATNESGTFVHEDEVKKFLHALTTQEKYPFSTPELRKELSHTMWYLNRVASAKALATLLRKDSVFCEYKIIVAAGDGDEDDDDDKAIVKSFDKVKKAIDNHDKTITLTVGQLTVGVTIPQWSGVLMLCNLQSPSAYIQAAFRAQNPYVYTNENGERMRKENAYVFDFDPARTLIIFDKFANNLYSKTANGKGTLDDRKENIKNLLNFFPVIGEDTEGKMVKLDTAQILSIPRRIKSQEVVRRGFMSNFLFQNISNVFGAPGIIREIIDKLTPTKEKRQHPDKIPLTNMDDMSVDENGNADVPNEIIVGETQKLFGPKIYEDMKNTVNSKLKNVIDAGKTAASDENKFKDSMKQFRDIVKDTVKHEVVNRVTDAYDVKSGTQRRMERQVDKEIDLAFDELQEDYEQQANIAKIELDRKRKTAESEKDIENAENTYQSMIDTALKDLTEGLQKEAEKTIEEKPQDLIEQVKTHEANAEKKTMETEVRDHLRGFSRTIPSFIMAYGDEKLTLANFDEYTEDNVFEEVTGISEADFRLLRDGGDRLNPETGEMEHCDGHLFDEVVFDDSIQEFLHKKQELADYFDESQEEDIFDYIPPQKTNQIFTPKWVVKMMVDELEENNPGCFDNPTNTFADLYMKSGLYIAEIVKRLFRSEKMKEIYPDDTQRIQHIFHEQVYGMAPTRIIYLISTNYILGFDDKLKSELENKNFVEVDAAKAAKDGELQELVNKKFGNKR